MTETTKDYSLLRPFDLEAAKRGEAICWRSSDYIPKYSIITPAGSIVANFFSSLENENIWGPQDFRMAPLCWVEGKPVYKGDVLYSPFFGKTFEVSGYRDGNNLAGYFEAKGIKWANTAVSNCTGTPPKVKREVKLVAFIDDRKELRWVREDIFEDNQYQRIPSEDKLIQFEE